MICSEPLLLGFPDPVRVTDPPFQRYYVGCPLVQYSVCHGKRPGQVQKNVRFLNTWKFGTYDFKNCADRSVYVLQYLTGKMRIQTTVSCLNFFKQEQKYEYNF
jgi:hypothetical protein